MVLSIYQSKHVSKRREEEGSAAVPRDTVAIVFYSINSASIEVLFENDRCAKQRLQIIVARE